MILLPAFVLAASVKQTPSGEEILKRSRAAYNSIQTLVQDATGGTNSYKGTAHIQFKRPGMLRVTGQTGFGSPYDMICDGRSCWVLSAGNWQDVHTPETGIATITGISASSGTLVPAALLKTTWGAKGVGQNPKRVSRETVDGHAAYRLEFERMNEKLWIDASSYLYLKDQMELGGNKMVVTVGKPTLNKPIPASTFKK